MADSGDNIDTLQGTLGRSQSRHQRSAELTKQLPQLVKTLQLAFGGGAASNF